MIFDEFDGIHASDEIKQKTLHNVMKQRSRKKRTGMTAALTLCVTCLLVVLFQPWRLMEASPAPAPAPTLAVYSYVTLDINPSMEWKLDEQQRVVRVTAYNKDADNILTELQLEGKQLDTAGKYRVIDEILRHDSAKSVEELQKLSMKELYSVLERYDPSAVPEGCHGRQMRKGHHHGS